MHVNVLAVPSLSSQTEALTDLYPSLPEVSVPRNPSPFAVFAAVRATCLESRQRQAAILQMQSAAAWKEAEEGAAGGTGAGGEEGGDATAAAAVAAGGEEGKRPQLPKIVGIGLQGVLEIIRESHCSFPGVCARALRSLLDILQGLQPEELSREPPAVMESMFRTLLELASLSDPPSPGPADNGDHIRALACTCLLSFAVALGDTGKLLRATSAMLMSPRGSERIVMPAILVSLQRSITSVMLAKTEHPDLMGHGVAATSNLDTFGIAFGGGPSPVSPTKVHGLASDGAFLYLLTDRGLFKVGSGYGGTIKGYVYRHREDFDSSPAWIGFAGQTLYYRPLSEEKDGAGGGGTKIEVCQVCTSSSTIKRRR